MLEALADPLVILVFAAVLFTARRSYVRGRSARRVGADIAVAFAVISFAGVVELAMGRTPTYQHGPIRVWSGNIHSDENSQQVADPYTFTHLVHGAALYALFRAAAPASAASLRFAMAITAESVWEVLENTDWVIERYRAETISLDYYGDSILNSIMDILACGLGFWLAKRLPVWATVCWVVVLETVLALWIRDNLILNILMLMHPVSSIRAWQVGS